MEKIRIRDGKKFGSGVEKVSSATLVLLRAGTVLRYGTTVRYCTYESFKKNFAVKIFKFSDADLGWKKFGSGMEGSATLVLLRQVYGTTVLYLGGVKLEALRESQGLFLNRRRRRCRRLSRMKGGVVLAHLLRRLVVVK
jgi:hypothetical protein